MAIENEIIGLDRDLKRMIAASFALQGLLSNPNNMTSFETRVEGAVFVADALIAELARTKK